MSPIFTKPILHQPFSLNIAFNPKCLSIASRGLPF
jgi:hypothetical protein